VSSFRGEDLFGSGPHRFSVARRGVEVVPVSVVSGDPLQPGSIAYGDREVIVEVRGRLVAATEALLWGLREAIVDEARFSLGSGMLVDTRGRSWDGMWFIRYEEKGTVDRGRVWSVGYEAAFRRVLAGV
jgi:hypothetical protein